VIYFERGKAFRILESFPSTRKVPRAGAVCQAHHPFDSAVAGTATWAAQIVRNALYSGTRGS